MSSKNKTQKRNERARRSNKQNKGGDSKENVKHSNKQQQELSKLSKDLKDTNTQLAGLQQMKSLWLAGKLPPPPVDDKKLDEKYIPVPTPVEIAISQIKETLETVTNPTRSVLSKSFDSKLVESAVNKLALINEAVKAVQKKPSLHIKVPSKLMNAIKLSGVDPVTDSEAGLGFTKAVLAAGLGDRPIKMRLSTSFVITTTVTTGVTNIVSINGTGNANLTPSNCTEFSSCAALFEQYKCLGGEVVFNYRNPVPGLTAANITSDSLPIMAYDADDNSLAGSSLVLTQASQHKIFEPTVYSGNVAAVGPYGVPACGIQHRFKFHVPKGAVMYVSATDAGTNWIPVGQPLPCGYLKFYHLGAVITANDTGAGFIYFDLEFRCRA